MSNGLYLLQIYNTGTRSALVFDGVAINPYCSSIPFCRDRNRLLLIGIRQTSTSFIQSPRFLPYTSTVMLTTTQSTSLLLVLWATYWLFKRFVRKSTLHNVRGPPSDSWLTGIHYHSDFSVKTHLNPTGNLKRVYDFNAFKTHRLFEEECKLHLSWFQVEY